jgi:hypothetical protein
MPSLSAAGRSRSRRSGRTSLAAALPASRTRSIRALPGPLDRRWRRVPAPGALIRAGSPPPPTLGLRGAPRRTAARRASRRLRRGSLAAPAPRRLPHRARQACASACVCPPRSRASAPSLRWLWPTERISGGHTSVGAMPASYQVTPAILGGGGRHGKSRSDPERSTGEIKSQPAAVREPNRRAGRHRPPRTQVLTEASCETDVVLGPETCVRVGACTRRATGPPLAKESAFRSRQAFPTSPAVPRFARDAPLGRLRAFMPARRFRLVLSS